MNNWSFQLIAYGWAAWLAYWLIMAFTTKKTLERRGRPPLLIFVSEPGMMIAVRRSSAAVLCTTTFLATAGVADGRTAPSGLPYSTASPHLVQRQPPRGSCHAIGNGLYARPDPRCTPGAVNPQVTQATIGSTICRAGWTSTVRPPESVTEPEKYASMEAYGLVGRASAYEYDHLVPLELGGAVNDPRNLWPELNYTHPTGYDELNPKDAVEYALNRRVCARMMTLAQAQRLIALDWVAAYRRYG